MPASLEPGPGQVVARDRHAELVLEVATPGDCGVRIVLELLLQRTEIREMEERRMAVYQAADCIIDGKRPWSSHRFGVLDAACRRH